MGATVPASGDPAAGTRPDGLTLCYTLADQAFGRTKSLGIFNNSLGLLQALIRRPEVARVHVLANRTLIGSLPASPRLTVSEHNAALGGKLQRIAWDQIGVARAARATGCEWLFLPKGFLPRFAPLPGPTTGHVHDVIQEFFRERYPQSYSWLDRRYFTWSLKATLRRAAVIFTGTEFGRQEVRRFAAAAGMSAPPIVLAGNGFDPVPAGPRGASPSIVCLASRWPHKRTDLALDYVARWQQETGYTGLVHWVGEAPEQLAWPAFPNWRRHARVDHTAYYRLVTEAEALLHFSEYEGFGMPPVEAVLRGTCPVYSRLPATTEVMAGMGQPFDNDRYESFCVALNQARTTPPETLAAWAAALLQRFSWEAVAARVVAGLVAAAPRAR